MLSAASGVAGPQAAPDGPMTALKDLMTQVMSGDSIAFLNTLAAKVRASAQAKLLAAPSIPSRFTEAFGRAQDLVSNQFASTPLAADIVHPFPTYPDTLFTWNVCNTTNPYLVVSVRDQEVSEAIIAFCCFRCIESYQGRPGK